HASIRAAARMPAPRSRPAATPSQVISEVRVLDAPWMTTPVIPLNPGPGRHHREIERVIFEAHPDDARDGTLDFAELLEHRASRHRLARDREAEAVSKISERISAELEKENLLATYEAQVAQKKKLVDAYTVDRAK